MLNAMNETAERTRVTSNPGLAVRRVRVARSVSVRGLAQRVKVSPATISAIENGKTGMSVQRLQEIAVALGVPIASLIDDSTISTEPRHSPSPSVEFPADDWRKFAPL